LPNNSYCCNQTYKMKKTNDLCGYDKLKKFYLKKIEIFTI
jgi:hypothetical protein